MRKPLVLQMAFFLVIFLAQSVAMVAAPKRIVTLGGVVTEIVSALGHEAEIVGVDATSIYPESMKKKPQLGFFKKVSSEGVIAQRPEIVIALAESGPDVAMDQIRKAGIKVVLVSQPKTTDEASATIRQVGAAIGEGAKAEKLVQTMKARIEEVVKKAQQRKLGLKVAFLYLRGAKVTMLAGKNTAIHNLVSKLGCVPVGTHESYIPLTAEALAAMQPDVIVVTKDGSESVGGIAGVKALPGVVATPAGRKGNIIEMEDALLLNMGSRTGSALDELFQQLSAAKGK